MEIVRYKRDVWGDEVILGVAWDLLWVVAVAILVLLAGHAIFMAALAKKKAKPSSEGRKINRHDAIDRAFHWIMAGSVLVLIATGVMPIIGIHFAWLDIHWIAGLLLTFVVIFHIIRASFWQDFKSMIMTPADFAEPFDESRKPGKYSFEQKGMHWAMTVLVLLVIVTGVILLMNINTPFTTRQAVQDEGQLGLMFLLHGLATLSLIAFTAIHIYFAVRPEKIFYTRSMIKGWISEAEMKENHDTDKWKV
ncbi:MAG: cytochrome b/b6 domain-containing protein [Pseudohongiella sp.]|jgi:formate dehydrogenase subunit gamma|nr:cytochrome b/b6 domain-containing protein [Pseudohongiella sp.]MDP1756034.1 cytochrome b/b6 domain-containing protein [Pseudohongiella sp.]